MFGFNKKKKQKEAVKKKGRIDKVVTGLIVGAAIGSVIGVGFAPQDGKETRKDVSRAAKGFFGKFKDKTKRIKDKFYPRIRRIKKDPVLKLPEEE